MAAAAVLCLALGGAGWRSRALATVPSNLKTPAWLAEQAVEVGEAAGLTVQVWDEEQLRAEGFGGVLARGCTIGQGLSAASALSLSAPIVLVSMVVGARLGLSYLVEGRSILFGWRASPHGV